MGASTAARLFLIIGLFTLGLVGFGYLGYAIFLAWLTVLPTWAAAAITALLLLLIPSVWLLALSASHPRRKAPPPAEDNTLAAFAAIAREKPLFGILLAGLFGIAEAANGKK